MRPDPTLDLWVPLTLPEDAAMFQEGIGLTVGLVEDLDQTRVGHGQYFAITTSFQCRHNATTYILRVLAPVPLC